MRFRREPPADLRYASSYHMLAGDSFTFLTAAAEAYVVYLFVAKGQFRRFLMLNLFLILSVSATVATSASWLIFGQASSIYFGLWILRPVMIWIVMFCGIWQTGTRLFGNRTPRATTIVLSTIAFLAAAWIRLEFLLQIGYCLRQWELFDLWLGLFYACCSAALLLWISRLKMVPQDSLAARILNVLCIYLGVILALELAVSSGIRSSDLASAESLWMMAEAWLPLGIGFALTAEQPIDAT